MGELVDVKLFHALHYSRIPAKIFRFGAGIESQGPTLHSPTLPPQNNKQYSLISVVFAKTSDFGGECLI